jgi:hypothetical protein
MKPNQKMTKNFIALFLFSSLLITSCRKDVKEANVDKPENLNLSVLKNSSLLNQLGSNLNEYSPLIKEITPDVNISDVDYSKAFIVSEKNKIGEGIGVNLYSAEGKIVTFMLSKNKSNIVIIPILSIMISPH